MKVPLGLLEKLNREGTAEEHQRPEGGSEEAVGQHGRLLLLHT